MKNLCAALLTGLLLAGASFVFFLSPWGQQLEENIGLALLFKMRGPRTPPDNIIIINPDQNSSQKMNLPEKFNKWPRTVHARLVDLLRDKKAAVIAFDVHFAEDRDSTGDHLFAESIQQAGNVVLFEKIQRKSLALPKSGAATGSLEREVLVPPVPVLAQSALALAPFPLPKLPVRINQAWIFKTSSGDLPTLPAAVLQALGMKQFEKLRQLIGKEITSTDQPELPPSQNLSPERFQEIGQGLRELFLAKPELAKRLDNDIATGSFLLSAHERKILQAMVQMFAGPNTVYFNFYGPPGSLPTYSYADLLTEQHGPDAQHLDIELTNKIVFIGAARKTWAGQKDGFYTVFSRPDGLNLSGVELAATAFANLYENNRIKPLSPAMSFALLAATGMTVALCCMVVSQAMAAFLLTVFSLCFLGIAHYFFSVHEIWPPVILPLGFQTPTAFLASLCWKYFHAGRERKNIQQALRFYLPDKAVKAISEDLSFIREGDQMVYSACLMTDAQHYTTLSEKMGPKELSILMKEYYAYLFDPVNKKGGVVSDVVGDSMLALWPSAKPLPTLRKNACQAAMQIIKAVEKFNLQHPHSLLPTRIGLHFGYILIGNIGAGSHFEYAPIGDIVNTASRIEGLNKHLGTDILATEEVVSGLEEIVTRKVGIFLLPGKSQPVIIHELLASTDSALNNQKGKLAGLFSRGLDFFGEQQWDDAIAVFQQCKDVKTDDGPALFYLNLCKKYQKEPPPPGWHGTVHINGK